jgi:hypothetical protein
MPVEASMKNSGTKLPNAEHFLQSALVSKCFNRELPRLSAMRLETDFVISLGVSPGFASTSAKISRRRPSAIPPIT